MSERPTERQTGHVLSLDEPEAVVLGRAGLHQMLHSSVFKMVKLPLLQAYHPNGPG
jgi:hypothetical protein